MKMIYVCYPGIISWIILSFLMGCSSSGGVVVRSVPAGAKVYALDPKTGEGALIGETPLSFDKRTQAPEGVDVIQLRLEKEGYQSKNTAIAVFGSGTTYLDMILQSGAVTKGEIRESFDLVRAHDRRMNELVLENRYAEALAEAEQILKLDPKNAETFAAKGSILFLMKDVDGARSAWSQALALNPGNEEVRNALLDLNISSAGKKDNSEKGAL
ncbi:MAG: PEGA domain-containing protein [Bdellovibrionales bacterium]|nr:PEGA domain-containing protein [Bdellovibrionales bacterium]